MAKRKKTRKKNAVPAPVADFDDKKAKVRQAARILSDAEEIRDNKAFMKQVKAEQRLQQAALKRAMR
jgi:hypothetical protein